MSVARCALSPAQRLFLPPFLLAVCLLAFSGCSPVTYPEAKVKEALQEIALKEYKVPKIEVEFQGTTLGVFLPLHSLFETDLKEALMSGKVTDMESLFQPSEEAINMVEDILFSMSRVMLSTDKKLDFYYLQATDLDKTGMDLSFIGQIDDLKRVRFWDIPRSEYRKRIIHDLKLNRAVLWHRPVRHFFSDLNSGTVKAIQAAYFPHTEASKWAKEFFFTDARGAVLSHGRGEWTLLDVRSIPIQDNEIVVYAKARVEPKVAGDLGVKPQVMEYLFQISTLGEREKIRRIIPLAYLDDKAAMPDFTFTRAMVYESLPHWETEFQTPDITMGDFLSRQLTRRFQGIVAEDERVYNTFSDVKLAVRFEREPEPHFVFNALFSLKKTGEPDHDPSRGLHEDVLYLWERLAREFVEVLRSYSFTGYRSLDFQLSQGERLLTWMAPREDLERFRRGKKDLRSILRFS